MNRETFERQHAATWERLERALAALDARRDEPEVGELPELYRATAHHLALARARGYGPDLELRLHGLALAGHQRLYGSTPPPTLGRMAEFLARGFPRQVRREGRLVLLSLALFLLPLLVSALMVWREPEAVYSVLDAQTLEQFEGMYGADGQVARPSSSDVMMFGFYVYNNVGIAFRTFATGILAGVGSAGFLAFNGLFLGVVAAHLSNLGLGGAFYPFAIGHGAFELTAIVLAGAAGMRLGLGVLAPGRRSRRAALLDAARQSVPMIYGVAAMLLVAAFVEAFWSSSSSLGAMPRLAVGAALWLLVGAWLLLAGRNRGS